MATGRDKTLPARGGWIIVTRQPPLPQAIPLLSMFFATPDRLFLKDWHTASASQEHMKLFDDADLKVLWRYRNRTRSMSEVHRLKARMMNDASVRLDQRVRIYAPDGSEICLEPYEWMPAGDVSPFFDAIGSGVTLHEIGQLAKGTLRDRVFYLMSRGISRVEAYTLLLGNINRSDILWLELDDAYARLFLGERTQKRTADHPMMVSFTASAP